uniref:Cohesin subunit SA-2 n=1 Tax=Cacopsylla melanoneura TaxID=428564 RepID=A0A8D8W339_9HEMI
MHRSIGKRIRMDDPIPPEYDTNPMTPMTEATDIQEPFTPYTPYSNHAQTPLHNPMNEMYTNEHFDNVVPQHQYAPSVYGGAPSPAPHMEYDQQPMSQEPESQPEVEPAPLNYEEPMTPQGRGGRITRARLRNAQNPQVSPPAQQEAPASKRMPPPAPADDRPKRGRGAVVRRPPNETINLDEDSLYNAIRTGRTALGMLVDEWIEQYKSHKESALLSLMQFFINGSGCKGKITSNMANNMEHAAIIRKMTEEFDEESGEYPLIMAGQQWKKFRSNFCDFVAHLVKQCQYSIIYDQYLMDNVISLLTGLSDSQVRAFRHTATLAAMKLMTALVDVALVVSVNLDNTQRQYESERQKTRDKRASDRLESLMTKRQELEENMDEIKNMLTYMFKSVFVHRYRDTLPEIRAICMAEIGVWMKKFHSNFLDDSYLKYIGWTLHDKVGEVRLKCLQALQPLYASEELKGKLELFTSKFKDRIVAMTLDKEYDVAVHAVRLVISILKHHRDILTDKDCEHVYELVYSSHRAVAQAAGEFLNERLFVPDDEFANVHTKGGKRRLKNTPLIRDLVQFFIESELHEHGAYLVDSLIESNEMMKDWECMTDLLLEEPNPKYNEEPLDDRQETSLIELMVCCVRQAATGDAPVGRGPNRRIASVKEVKQVQDDKQRLTEHFIKVLPRLLDKYSADPDKLTNLLSLPQYFDLNIYTTSRREKDLDELLKKLMKIVDKHNDTDVLDTCAKTLETLCCEENASIFTRCDVQRRTLIEKTIVDKYTEALDDWNNSLEAGVKPDDDETFALVSSLKKIAIFYSNHNMGQWNVWDSLFKTILEAQTVPYKSPPQEGVQYCMRACFFSLLWDLHQCEELAASGAGQAVDDAVQESKTRLYRFMEAMRDMLKLEDCEDYKEEAYITICDMLVTFCNQLASNPHHALSELIYEADDDLLTVLDSFIQSYVFIYEEEDDQDEHSKIEMLHKRRNCLASFCKLVVYGMIPTSWGAGVFKHYVKSYNTYGDIIKTSVGKAREVNKVNCARTMVLSLTQLYKELPLTESNQVPRQSNDFNSLKELAKRFALSFGLDAMKNREAVTVLHKEGILFSVSPRDGNMIMDEDVPPYLPFLEVLAEFTNKLLRQDKRVILNFLNHKMTCPLPSSRHKNEDWQPLELYKQSLLHGDSETITAGTKKNYSRKNKKDLEEEHEDLDMDNLSLDENDFGGHQQHEEQNLVHQRPVARKPKAKRARMDPPPMINAGYEEQGHHVASRPARQCTTRSLAYKYMDRYSDDDDSQSLM